MRLRLFAAIALPDEVVSRLAPLQRDVAGATWLAADRLHLTLRFFGEIDDGRARDLDEALGSLSDKRQFDLSLKGVGAFGGRETSVLWAGIEPQGPVIALAGACERAARRLNFTPEPRKFAPHVTLAYCHGVNDLDTARFLERNAEFRTEPFAVDQFALFSSWPGKHGRRYVEEAVYPLAL